MSRNWIIAGVAAVRLTRNPSARPAFLHSASIPASPSTSGRHQSCTKPIFSDFVFLHESVEVVVAGVGGEVDDRRVRTMPFEIEVLEAKLEDVAAKAFLAAKDNLHAGVPVNLKPCTAREWPP